MTGGEPFVTSELDVRDITGRTKASMFVAANRKVPPR